MIPLGDYRLGRDRLGFAVSLGAFGILLAVWVLMVAQKYLRYGHSPEFELAGSLSYNLLSVVPFVGLIVGGLWLGRRISRWHPVGRGLVFGLSCVVALSLYVIAVNALLFLLGMSSSWLSVHFVMKYLAGLIHVHAALYLVAVLTPIFVISRNGTRKPESHGSGEVERELAGLPLKSIHRLEADDHYVWIHTASESCMERATLRGLEKTLPPNFRRVHRSHIVNLDHVERTRRDGRHTCLVLGPHKVRVSDSYRESVLSHLA